MLPPQMPMSFPAQDDAAGPQNMPRYFWFWIGLEWSFLAVLAYHLILEHVPVALPYVLAVIALALAYIGASALLRRSKPSSPRGTARGLRARQRRSAASSGTGFAIG